MGGKTRRHVFLYSTVYCIPYFPTKNWAVFLSSEDILQDEAKRGLSDSEVLNLWVMVTHKWVAEGSEGGGLRVGP